MLQKIKGSGVKPDASKKMKKKLKGAKDEGGLKKSVKRKFDDDGEAETDAKQAKVDWKAVQKKHKDLKLQRKQQDRGATYELSVKSKKIWEELRRDDCRKGRREQLSNELYGMIRGKATELAYSHDTARVIECLVSVASEAVRTALFSELQPQLMTMIKSKYAHFMVPKMIKHGTKEQKQTVIQAFSGHVAELMRHKMAASVVEDAYNEFATSKERALMRQEYYGVKFRVFKDPEIRSVRDAIEKEPSERPSILRFMREQIQHMIDKELYYPSLLHNLLHEYLTACDLKDRSDMIESLSNSLPHMIHTKDGARVAMMCLWHGNKKDRKAIVKSFKTHVVKISAEEHGHMVLLALADCIDDTVLVKKVILSEFLSDLSQVVTNDYSRKVLLYFISPRDPAFFHADIVAILKQGDGNEHSKKDTAIRRSELLAPVCKPVLDSVASDISLWTSTNAIMLLTSAVFTHCFGPGRPAALSALAEWATQPSDPNDPSNPIEGPAGHMMLKKIIKADKTASSDFFSLVLLNSVSPEALKQWVSCNRGAFILVCMLETEVEPIVDLVRTKTSPLMSELASQKTQGAKILRTKLQE